MARPGEVVESIEAIVRREERKRAEQERKAWKPRNVILYTRVSTPEQALDGHSLEDQDEILNAYCVKFDYHVIKTFVDPGKSATSVEKRLEFLRMIEYCKENYKIIHAVVINIHDRYFRNAKLHAVYRDMLADLGILFRSPHYCYKLRPDAAEMMAAAESQGFSEALSETMKRARAKALKDGREAGRVPIGYLQVRDTDKPRGCKIEVDPVRAPIIAEAINSFVYSSRTRQSLHEWAVKKGLTSPQTNRPVHKNTFLKVFENPKYGGMQYDAEGQFRISIHPPIVTPETMRLSITKALEGNPSRRVAHERNLDGIPLRNVLCCPECGKRLSGSKSKGKMGQRFAYYHLPRHESHCTMKKLRLPSKDVNEAFLDVLERLKIDPVIIDLIEVFARDRQKRSREANGAEVEALTAERDRAREVLDGVVDRYALGKISDDEYQRAVSRNEDINTKLEARIEGLKKAELPLDQLVFRAATALEHPDVTWSLLSDDARNRMAHALFPDGIRFNENMKPVMFPKVFHGGMITVARKPVWRKTWWRKKPTKKSLDAKP